MREFLQELGIRLTDVVAGAAGGVVHAFVFKKADPWAIVGSVVVGTLTATYITQSAALYVNKWMQISDGTAGFFVGLCGMAICQAVMAGVKSWRLVPPKGAAMEKTLSVLDILDDFDISAVFITATLAGFILIPLALATTIRKADCPAFVAYRFGYVCLGLTYAWTFFYADARNWQPWPPHLGMIVVIDYLMIVRLLRHWHIRKNSATLRKPVKSA